MCFPWCFHCIQNMADLTLYLLRCLNYNFTVDENATTKEFAVLRTKFQNAEEVHSFIKKIETHTKTNFVTRYNNPHVEKVLFHKKWICRSSSYRKQAKSKRNAGCTSFIDVIIKKINKYTQRNDKFLKMKDPLPCLIKINLEHSHSTENVDATRKLRVTPEIKNEFEEYFKRGLVVCEARRLHEERLTARYDYSILTNSAFNPTINQVYYLYQKWRAKNIEPMSEPFNKLEEKSCVYKNKAGVNGMKRRKLKKTAIPSCNLPSSSEYMNECQSNIKLENSKKSKSNEKTLISKGSTEDIRKLTCVPDETDSDESTENQEDVTDETSVSSVDDINEEHNLEHMDTSPNIMQLSILTPSKTHADIVSHADVNDIEHTSKNMRNHTQNCTPPFTVNYKESSVFDCSAFKSSPNDSKELLTQKLETMLSLNAALQKKVEFYQRRCKIYEKEVNILKGVIDNLKLINSVTFDN